MPRREAASTRQTDTFRPVELGDRVVIMALFYQIVRIEEVEQAWTRWKAHERADEALWRVLCQEFGHVSDAIYALAAQLYGFEEATFQHDEAQDLLHELRPAFTKSQWRQMADMLVVPVSVGADPGTGQARLVFASPDPVRPEVMQWLRRLELGSFSLQYAPADAVRALLGGSPNVESIQERAAREAPVVVDYGAAPPAHEAEETDLDRSSLASRSSSPPHPTDRPILRGGCSSA